MQVYKIEEKHQGANSLLVFLFIVAAIALRLYIIYFPFRLYEYLVPPGGDPVGHIGLINQILQGGISSNYPTLFHLIIAFLSRIFGSDPISVLKSVTPAMMVLPSIGIYIFLKKSYGKLAALIGFMISLFASNYALVAFGDGNYPNILASGFFIPIAFAFVLKALDKKSFKNYFWAVIFTILLLLTHHLSFATFLIILIAYLIILSFWNKYEKIAVSPTKFTFAFLVLIGILVIATILTPLREPMLGAINALLQSGAVAGQISFSYPIDFADYGSMVGPLVYFGGLLALFYLVYMLGLDNEEINKKAVLFVIVWFVILFVLSRLNCTGLPGRFARELALPLLGAISISLSHIFSKYKHNLQKIVALGLLGMIVAACLVQVNGGSYSSPKYYNSMVWFTKSDLEKADYIKWVTEEDDVILSNRTTPYMSIFTKRKFVYNTEQFLKSQGAFQSFAKNNGAKYLFIGKITSADPDPVAYPFFNGFDAGTLKMQELASELTKVHEFSDGSVLYSFVDF